MPLVPRILDCGGCLAGGTKLWTIKCTNFGGDGNFKILSSDGSVEKSVSDHYCDTLGAIVHAFRKRIHLLWLPFLFLQWNSLFLEIEALSYRYPFPLQQLGSFQKNSRLLVIMVKFSLTH